MTESTPEAGKFIVVWKLECLHPHEGRPELLIIGDDGSDKRIQCSGCGAEGDLHDFVVSDVAKRKCWRCNGTGKLYSGKTCFTCNGTGIEHLNHLRKLVGRVKVSDIIKLAKQDPQGWEQ